MTSVVPCLALTADIRVPSSPKFTKISVYLWIFFTIYYIRERTIHCVLYPYTPKFGSLWKQSIVHIIYKINTQHVGDFKRLVKIHIYLFISLNSGWDRICCRLLCVMLYTVKLENHMDYKNNMLCSIDWCVLKKHLAQTWHLMLFFFVLSAYMDVFLLGTVSNVYMVSNESFTFVLILYDAYVKATWGENSVCNISI